MPEEQKEPLPDEAIGGLIANLKSSLLEFTQVFYQERTGREFILSLPSGRESHFISIAKALSKVFTGETKRLIINVPPRYGKTELAIHFIAWALAQCPDSNFLYVSYAHNLARKQTQIIRSIVDLPSYRYLFDVHLSTASSAKDDFELTEGGSVYAAGAGGSITGRGAGIMGCDRFGGAIIIDDIHKPDEVTSDPIRDRINDWFYNTMQSRLNNGEDTPIIFIGQRLHEDDLPSNLIETGDWETLVLPALDEAGNALYPELHDKQALLKMQKTEQYVYASQYQQNPQPAGGGLFKSENFYLTDSEPQILTSFITADTAETDKNWNDKTVFSFFGLYKVKHGEDETDIFGLHWIDCVELQIEPDLLESEFRKFYADCCRYKKPPSFSAIEKKSTGTTLLSVLKSYQGMQIMDIERTRASGNKAARYIEMQKYISSRLISLPRYGRHTSMCIEHMRKITANNTHRFDDIADTLYDGVKLGLIDKVLMGTIRNPVVEKQNEVAKKVMENYMKLQEERRARKW